MEQAHTGCVTMCFHESFSVDNLPAAYSLCFAFVTAAGAKIRFFATSAELDTTAVFAIMVNPARVALLHPAAYSVPWFHVAFPVMCVVEWSRRV